MIYTNLNLGAFDRVCTRIGSLINLDTSHTPAALGYEMTEYMEAAEPEGDDPLHCERLLPPR
ncbi:hypothetical protein D3C76_1798790 [compost metagenome]